VAESNNIEPARVQKRDETDHFWGTRGRAIAAYASVEQSLCSLFCILSRSETDVASLIFFRFTNPRVIGEILDALLRKRHGETYSPFWNSLDKNIRQLVDIRNHVVHWSVTTRWDDGHYAGIRLIPQDHLNLKPTMQDVNTEALLEFISKCAFIYRLCDIFCFFLQPDFEYHLPGERVETWREIFQQPIVYPPPNTHPLYPKPKAPETQHPPSLESPQS